MHILNSCQQLLPSFLAKITPNHLKKKTT